MNIHSSNRASAVQRRIRRETEKVSPLPETRPSPTPRTGRVIIVGKPKPLGFPFGKKK